MPESFSSAADVRFFFAYGAECAIASDDLYEYVMCRTKDTIDVVPDVVYHKFREIFMGDISEMAWKAEIDRDIDGFHETMKRLSGEYKFDYVRTVKNGSQ